MNEIAKILKKEKIYIPSVYAMKKGFKKPLAKPPLGEYLWTHVMIREILSNQSYVGDVINFKTYSKSFKLKERLENDKENWQVHKDVHEPIIDRELFEMIQKTFKTTKCQKPRHVEKNIFAGFLRCSDAERI